MSPSNTISEKISGVKVFENLARRKSGNGQFREEDVSYVNNAIVNELTEAGITFEGPFKSMLGNSEVPYMYLGNLGLWGFKRAWYYWIAEGPGIPADKAEEFHKDYGKQCRVDGHCACPSPLEWYQGFAIGMYHIDTQIGLNAFANLLNSIWIKPAN